MSKQQLDFLGYGDVVIDTFIELMDAWVETDNPEQAKELCMKFGSKMPYKNEVVVDATGNAANAAHAAMKLGLNAGVVTNIGGDENGQQIMRALENSGLNHDWVETHSDKNSNHNYILRFKEERTILVHHNEYEYKFPVDLVPPKWIYLSSLAHNSLSHHHEIAGWLADHPETKLAFQPGTFQIKLGAKELADMYAVTEIFFCNKEEACRILETKDGDIKNLLKGIADLGPKIVVITDGPDGAYVLDSVSGDFWHGPMYPDVAPPVDRTGAGDTFSATFTVAIAMGKSIKEALMMAPINSMNVVQYVGAQAGHLTMDEIAEYLEKAPADYKPNKI